MQESSDHTILGKLLRKPSAAAATILIFLVFLVGVFAYVIAPDNTPYANRMIIEHGAREPGFEKQLLYTPVNVRQQSTGFFNELFSGRPSDYTAVPMNGYSFINDQMLVRHYIDEDLEDTLIYNVSEIYNGPLPASLQEKVKYISEHQVEKQRFYLGTDRYGRDILSRLIVGARVSIAVGFIAVILSITIGIFLGSLAGYYGGVVDNAVMWIINILWAIPTLLLVFAITLTIGKGFWEIFIAIGLTMWVSAARLIRGQVMALREMEYVTAARAIGLSDTRIIFRHILPNIAGPIMVIAASNFATAILVEAGLSFLGIGVQPPQPSWGLMIKEHYNFLLTNRPLIAIIPGIAIMILVYAFNVLGNALRDVLDVRS